MHNYVMQRNVPYELTDMPRNVNDNVDAPYILIVSCIRIVLTSFAYPKCDSFKPPIV